MRRSVQNGGRDGLGTAPPASAARSWGAGAGSPQLPGLEGARPPPGTAEGTARGEGGGASAGNSRGSRTWDGGGGASAGNSPAEPPGTSVSGLSGQ